MALYPASDCNRREVLRAGALTWLGLGLVDVLRLQGHGAPAQRPIGGVILAFCPGGPSHLETLDPKPQAPAEIRGSFSTIASALAGVRLGEHLPQVAKRLGQTTLVRSMTTTSPVHELAVHSLLGGVIETPPGTGVAASRLDRPHLGALLAAARPAAAPVPPSVVLPTRLTFEGAVFPGQNAGFLGARYDPWHLVGDPNNPGFGPANLTLSDDLRVGRLEARARLLAAIDDQRRALDAQVTLGNFDAIRRQALNVLTSSACRTAFNLSQESAKLRERYGRTLMGQGLLLGRRLIEAGVRLVQVNLGDSNVWDTHTDNFNRLKNVLLPPFDQAVSALIDDLAARGLLDEVLVIVSGEFGRTPRIGTPIKGGAGATPTGRDHWPGVFSLLAFGAGVGRGQVLGSSDRSASHPASASYTPADLAATILASLKVDASVEIHDQLGRPFTVNTGTPIPWR
jgi:Protein of unknown function (DUF1501)